MSVKPDMYARSTLIKVDGTPTLAVEMLLRKHSLLHSTATTLAVFLRDIVPHDKHMTRVLES